MLQRSTLTATLIAFLALSSPLFGDALRDVLEGLQHARGETRAGAWMQAAALEAAAIPALAALTDSERPEVALAAWRAIERLAHASAAPGREGERERASNELAALLRSAERSAAAKERVLDLLSSAGTPSAISDIEALLADPQLRDPARRALGRIPGKAATAALTRALATAGAEFLPQLIATLGERRDPRALEPLAGLARGAVQPLDVRVPAALALARIGEPRALETILAVLEAAGPRQPASLLDALLAMAERLDAAGERSLAAGLYRQLLEKAAGESARCAALLALATPPTTSQLPILLPALGSDSPRLRRLAGELLGGLGGEAADRELLARLERARGPEKAAILRVLSVRRTPGIAELLESATRDEDLDVKITALELSGGLGDPALEPLLLEAAREGSGPVRAVALESYLELAGRRLEADPLAAANMFEQALALAAAREPRGRALSGLGRTGAPGALAKIEALLARPEDRGEAVRAKVLYARVIGAAGEKERAVELLHAVLGSEAPRETAAEAISALKELGADPSVFQAKQGFIASWWLIGPFPNQGNEAWTKAYFPEERIVLEGVQTASIGGRERRFAWRQVQSTSLEGVIDLEQLFRRAQETCAYAYAEVESASERDVLLKIGSDDGVVVWLNGERVHANNATRPLIIDQDTAAARLQAGKNRILVKILQGGGQWAFCVRLADRDGKPLDLSRR
jgi:HEAT repeat protein